MRKEKEFNILEFEDDFLKLFGEVAKEHDKFIMNKLYDIKNKYVGWRCNKPEPCIIKTNMYYLETPIRCDMSIEFIGFDNEKEVDYYINQGFLVCDKKNLDKFFNDDTILKFNIDCSEEDIKNLEKSNLLYFKEEPKEEVINSLELEDYLNNFINDEDNSLKEKIKISSFLNDYMDKDLYVVEFIKDGALYIRVENEDDEIISDEFYIGEISKDLDIDNFELLAGTDHTINYYVDSIIVDNSINSDDKIFMIKDFIKHLNKGLYRMDAVDKFENMCQLIMDQRTDKIVDVIYY